MKNSKLVSALATASLLAAVSGAYAACAPCSGKKCNAKMTKCAGKQAKHKDAMKKCSAKMTKCGAKCGAKCSAKKM